MLEKVGAVDDDPAVGARDVGDARCHEVDAAARATGREDRGEDEHQDAPSPSRYP